MSNIWFTSDTHFGHKNIVKGISDWADKSTCRDFTTIEDHDAYIIDIINKMVKPTDTLYHLGDFGLGFKWKERLSEVRRLIKCETIHLLVGNHDHVIEEANSAAFPNDLQKSIKECFASIKYLSFRKLCKRLIANCHYAMLTWPWQHQGSIQLHGHSHGNLLDDPHALRLDVGFDTCLYGHKKYTLYSIEEIFHIIDNHKKFVPVDHHM